MTTPPETRPAPPWSCDGCGAPLDRYEPHRAVSTAVEQLVDNGRPDPDVTVSAPVEVAFYCLHGCAPDVGELLGRETRRGR